MAPRSLLKVTVPAVSRFMSLTVRPVAFGAFPFRTALATRPLFGPLTVSGLPSPASRMVSLPLVSCGPMVQQNKSSQQVTWWKAPRGLPTALRWHLRGRSGRPVMAASKREFMRWTCSSVGSGHCRQRAKLLTQPGRQDWPETKKRQNHSQSAKFVLFHPHLCR